MSDTQKRKFYRLQPSDTDPVLLHLHTKTYKTVDISITGLKVRVHEIRPEWEIGEIVDVIIELPNAKSQPKIHVQAKICYLDSIHLGLQYVDLTVADKRIVSEYVLKLTKSMGFW